MSHIAPKRCPYTYSVWRVSCDIDIINSTRTATARNTYNEHCMIKRCTGDTTRSRCIPRKYISCNNICKTMGCVISLRSLFCIVIRRNQFKKTINIIPSPIMLIVRIISLGSHSPFRSRIAKKKKSVFLPNSKVSEKWLHVNRSIQKSSLRFYRRKEKQVQIHVSLDAGYLAAVRVLQAVEMIVKIRNGIVLRKPEREFL